MGKPKTYAGHVIALFADTNELLDSPPFDTIKWFDDVFPGAEVVHWIITPPNIDEIQSFKDGGKKPAYRDRATNTVRRINDWFDNGQTEIAPNVFMRIDAAVPAIPAGLNPDVTDHRLLACISDRRRE